MSWVIYLEYKAFCNTTNVITIALIMTHHHHDAEDEDVCNGRNAVGSPGNESCCLIIEDCQDCSCSDMPEYLEDVGVAEGLDTIVRHTFTKERQPNAMSELSYHRLN